jgi:hypothetical protein
MAGVANSSPRFISHTNVGPPFGNSFSSFVSGENMLCVGPRNGCQSLVTAPAGSGFGAA